MARLPSEVWAHVFEAMDDDRSFCCLARTCRELAQVARHASLWRTRGRLWSGGGLVAAAVRGRVDAVRWWAERRSTEDEDDDSSSLTKAWQGAVRGGHIHVVHVLPWPRSVQGLLDAMSGPAEELLSGTATVRAVARRLCKRRDWMASAVQWAAHAGRVDVLQALVEEGGASCVDGDTLRAACGPGSAAHDGGAATVRWLIASGPVVEGVVLPLGEALVDAVGQSHADKVAALLAAGAPVSDDGSLCRMAVRHFGSARGARCIELLLETAGPQPFVRASDQGGATPIEVLERAAADWDGRGVEEERARAERLARSIRGKE